MLDDDRPPIELDVVRLPDGLDANAFAIKHGIPKLREYVEENVSRYTGDTSTGYSGSGPKPLDVDNDAAAPYPVAALGTICGNFAKAGVLRSQAPVEVAAHVTLAAAVTAVQIIADVIIPLRRTDPGIGETKPCSSFLLSIATTGERGSTASVG